MHSVVRKRSGGSFAGDEHDFLLWRLGLEYGEFILCCTRRFDTAEVAEVAVRLEVQRILG